MPENRTSILFLLLSTLALTLTLSSAEKLPKQSRVKLAKRGCLYKDVLHPPGSRFKPEPCTTCRCRKRSGVVHCVVKDCTADRHCLKFYKGKRNRCCPSCLEEGCRHTGGSSRVMYVTCSETPPMNTVDMEC